MSKKVSGSVSGAATKCGGGETEKFSTTVMEEEPSIFACSVLGNVCEF